MISEWVIYSLFMMLVLVILAWMIVVETSVKDVRNRNRKSRMDEENL